MKTQRVARAARAAGVAGAGAMLLSASVFAQTPASSGTGWYTGFGLGQSRLGFKTGDFAIGPPGTGLSFDDSNAAFKFFAGYRILPWLAIEGGYDNLGNNPVTFSNAAGTARMSYRVDALKFAGVGSFAFGNTGFSAFGKLGFGYTRARGNTSNFPTVLARGNFSERDWQLSPLIGAGVQYQLPRGLALRAEYEHYNEVGDSGFPMGRASAGLWSLSLMYLF